MYCSRHWSVSRHNNNLHEGKANVIPFVAYIAGLRAGLYYPKFRPNFPKKETKTESITDIMKDKFWKAAASNVVTKALNPSRGYGYHPPYQTFYDSLRAYSNNSTSMIPKPEEIFGFKGEICKSCLSINIVVISFNEGNEGGSKIFSIACCPSRKVEHDYSLYSKNYLRQIEDKLKLFVLTWTNKKPILIAMRLTEDSHRLGHVNLIKKGLQMSISLQCGEFNDCSIDVHKGCFAKSIQSGQTSLSDEELSDFLRSTKTTTYGLFKVDGEQPYLLAIINKNDVIKLA
jgi:hypothetical protein